MIDAHCHLQGDGFDEVLESALLEAKALGIKRFVVNGTSEKDWGKVAELAQIHPEVMPCFGLHPWYIRDRSPHWLDDLEAKLEQFPRAGVGEIGLDRWVKDHDIADQISVFESQWRLAVEKQRPISLHCLKAWGLLDQCLQNLPAARFLIHSYSGSKEMIPRLVKLGAWFSISGYFLRPDKAAKLEVFQHVPEDRLLLETDAPEMELPEHLNLYPDVAFNHPANLAVVYREISARKKMDVEKLKRQISQNFENWFNAGSSP